MTQDHWLRFYLARRAGIERAAWVLLLFGLALANASTVMMDIDRARLSFEPWEVLTWEFSSAVMWLVVLPGIVRAMDAKPLRWGLLRRHLPWHLLFSLVCSLAHVVGMVLLRKAVYATQGATYDFGDWPRELRYEAIKDVRSYFFLMAIVGGYRLALWRWQGEASELSAPPAVAPVPPAAAAPEAVGAGGSSPPGVASSLVPSVDTPPESPPPDRPTAPSAISPSRPERLLVKKLGTEFLLPVDEIEWVQACGNYVNLRRDRHDYPLRSTLAAFEQRLDPAAFVRVHRSYLVRLSLIQAIEPTEAGDAQLRLRDGSRLPCSRTYLDRLRARLA